MRLLLHEDLLLQDFVKFRVVLEALRKSHHSPALETPDDRLFSEARELGERRRRDPAPHSLRQLERDRDKDFGEVVTNRSGHGAVRLSRRLGQLGTTPCARRRPAIAKIEYGTRRHVHRHRREVRRFPRPRDQLDGGLPALAHEAEGNPGGTHC